MKLIFGGMIAGLAIALLFACKAKQASATDAKPEEAGIIWGSGGGITGRVVSYQLLKSGQIIITDGPKLPVPLKTVKPNVAKALFGALKDLNFSEINQNAPGNYYYFLQFNHSGKPHRITWGDASTETPQKVQDLHRVLMQLVQPGAN